MDSDEEADLAAWIEEEDAALLVEEEAPKRARLEANVPEKSHIDYAIRLRAVVGVVKFLLEQGLGFRGHDESSTSLNKGNFREMLNWYGARCKDVADVINENAPGSLSHALQSKDQNIVSAMNMIVSVKSLLQKLKDDGWEPLLLAVTNFCGGRNIIVPNMDDNIAARGYPRSSRKMVTCFHHYKVEIFNEVLDRNIVEMNQRFSETSTRLLLCTACLDLRDSFSSFDNDKLVELATMYFADFSSHDCCLLVDQLDIYVDVMKRSLEFIACDSLSDLALKLVQKRHHLTFPLVYRLITLVLTLPVATASVERVLSAMNIIKSDLRNKIGDDWLNDLMICYVEKEIFAKIDEKKIMLRFHSYSDRRGHLPRQFRLANINMDST